ncbi:MAG: chromate efflux transporter [Verrucomicrobia bacterium]|nr:chromate efflux transporter [Verrucomicrobiota bacterium]
MFPARVPGGFPVHGRPRGRERGASRDRSLAGNGRQAVAANWRSPCSPSSGASRDRGNGGEPQFAATQRDAPHLRCPTAPVPVSSIGVDAVSHEPTSAGTSDPTPLRELAAVFLKLGLIAFGGPAAHVGLMEDEFVRRRKWLTHEKFADLLAASNLIPGPNSTEMAIYIGQQRAGFRGLVVAGACFILPATLIVMAIAWGYQRYGTLPQLGGLLYGVKPVIIAVIVQALWGLARKSLKSARLAFLGAAALALGFLGVHELLLLLGAGLLATASVSVTRKPSATDPVKSPNGLALFAWPASSKGLLGAAATGTAAAAGVKFGLLPLFLFFLKVGAVLYGSGYVLLAFLRADLVERWHWLSEAQLLDAIAVGQITPGPLFTTATFVGYVLGGPGAALLATLGIFLPAFVFVAVSGPIIPRLRNSKWAGAFLDGVVVASLALMVVVTWYLARAALVDGPTVVLAAVSAVLLFRFRVNSVWLVLGGAAVGLAASFLGR